MSTTRTADERGGNLTAGAALGVTAFAVGYLLTYVAASEAVRESFVGAVAEETWRGVGWVFFSAHFVETVGTLSRFGVQLTSSVNLVNELDGVSQLVYLVPPVLLLAAGAVAGRGAPDLRDAALSGLAVAAGYLPLAAVGVYAVRQTGNWGSLGPDPVLAVALAGVAYPVAFGVVGGVVGRTLSGP